MISVCDRLCPCPAGLKSNGSSGSDLSSPDCNNSLVQYSFEISEGGGPLTLRSRLRRSRFVVLESRLKIEPKLSNVGGWEPSFCVGIMVCGEAGFLFCGWGGE